MIQETGKSNNNEAVIQTLEDVKRERSMIAVRVDKFPTDEEIRAANKKKWDDLISKITSPKKGG